MKQPLIAFIAFFFLYSHAKAQLPYTFTTYQQKYVPLSGAVSINNGTVWEEANWYSVPMGFNFKFDVISFNTFNLQGPVNVVTFLSSAVTTISSFILTDANLLDRGWGTASSKSPMRYVIDGTPGSRIFKYELFNAGFQGEYDTLRTLNDSVDLQVWLYEGSNVVELRYGPSQITHPDYYFLNSMVLGKTAISYGQDIDPAGNGDFWVLAGDPLNPTIQDIPTTNWMPVDTPTCLSSFPPNGTVYRFTPIKTEVPSVSQNSISVYPTLCHNQLLVNYNNIACTHYIITSASGTNVISGSLSTGVNKIDVSPLTNGLYFINLQSEKGNSFFKFTKY